jgi:hypothetical protein
MSDFGAFRHRYRSQGNIIWIAGGDANPMDYPGMDAQEDALMSALAADDTGRKLVTGHAGRHVSGFQGFGTHAWLTLNSAYDGESCPDDSMSAQIATEYARTPVKPLHSIEQLYDNEGATAQCLADQYLWIALGGGVGQSYGNGLVWDFAAGDGQGTGVNSPLALCTRTAKLVRSREFWLFAPDDAQRGDLGLRFRRVDRRHVTRIEWRDGDVLPARRWNAHHRGRREDLRNAGDSLLV